jgi:hypothetical protein
VMTSSVTANSVEGPQRRLWRRAQIILAVLGAVFLASAGLEIGEWVVLHTYGQPRLDRLYRIATGLQRGMPRERALTLIAAESGPELSQHHFPNGDVTLWVHYGLVDSCSLAVAFEHDKVVSTHMIGEDSPTDFCPSAPPNILRGR